MKKILLAIACVISLQVHAGVVIDNTISGSTVDTFDADPTGNVSGFISAPGATYGEHFSGQVVTPAGGFDVISGTPTSLTLQSNGSQPDNIGILNYNGSNVIYGDLGSQIGEGMLSILLGMGSDVFGFNVVGADAGQYIAQFFAADGSLLGSITQTANDGFYGFRATGGDQIWGISLTNTDGGGIAYDNVQFNASAQVPEPTTLALLGLGLLGMAASRRRKQ